MKVLIHGPGLERALRFARERRGTTFIIVLGILSLLALIVSAMQYSTRLDVLANGYVGNAVQRQIAGSTGLPLTTLALSELKQTARTQSWYQIGQPPVTQPESSPAKQDRPSVFSQKAGAAVGLPGEAAGGGAEHRGAWNIPAPRPPERQLQRLHFERQPGEIFRVADECAKFNVNVLGSWEEFEVAADQPAKTRVTIKTKSAGQSAAAAPPARDSRAVPRIRLTDALRVALEAEQVNAPGLAEALARAILEHKYGPDGQPGRAGFDDDGDSPGRRGNLLTNGVDDDGDGLIDNPEELAISLQSDRLDQNQDGRIDDADEHLEANGLDDDGDGQVDEPGEGVDEPDEFNPDPRFAPNGDDNPFESLNELLQIPLVTPEIFSALSRHFTVFSAGEPQVEFAGTQDGERISSPPLSLNTATAAEIVTALEKLLPAADPLLIRQFTANMIDERDPDRVPTEIANPFDPLHPLLGLEPNVVIYEICSDVATEELDGDDGQFIEFYNPWDEEMSVEGFQLNTGAGVYTLSGAVPPGGFLILTDDINGANDPERETGHGKGSFYDVFGQLGGGAGAGSKRLIEIQHFDLPNTVGEIRLYNAEGRLIDYAAYSNGQFDGFNQSLQRGDPRVRFYAKMTATPFERNANDLEPQEWSGADPFAIGPRRDKPFTSPAEVMQVYAGYVDRSGLPHEWALPTIHPAGNNRLDSRIIDLFMLERAFEMSVGAADDEDVEGEDRELSNAGREPKVTRSRFSVRRGDTRTAAARDGSGGDSGERRESAWDSDFRRQRARENMLRPLQYGRLNLNTGSQTALLALPEMTEELAGRIIEYREFCERENERLRFANPGGGVIIPFEKLSDLLRQDALWEGIGEGERLRLCAAWLPCLTVNSRAFKVEYGPRLSTVEKLQQLLPVKYRALLALDGRGTRVVNLTRCE